MWRSNILVPSPTYQRQDHGVGAHLACVTSSVPRDLAQTRMKACAVARILSEIEKVYTYDLGKSFPASTQINGR